MRKNIITLGTLTSPAFMLISESHTNLTFGDNCLWCKMSNKHSNILVEKINKILVCDFSASGRFYLLFSDLKYCFEIYEWCLPLLIWRHKVDWGLTFSIMKTLVGGSNSARLMYCKLIVKMWIVFIWLYCYAPLTWSHHKTLCSSAETPNCCHNNIFSSKL